MEKNFKVATIMLALFLLTAPVIVYAQAAPTPPSAHRPFSVTKVFTFLFLTLGPFKVFRPFSILTRDRDAAFRRKLAFVSLLISVVAAVLAATLGAAMLEKWGVSAGALHLTTGIVLFLIALQPVLSQYAPHQQPTSTDHEPERPLSALAFSPLAFPTIVTPYGIAVLILLVTLRPDYLWQILGLTMVVFLLDLLAMLGAGYIMRKSFLVTVIGIIGTILGVLQVALGVQAVVNALHILGLAHNPA